MFLRRHDRVSEGSLKFETVCAIRAVERMHVCLCVVVSFLSVESCRSVNCFSHTLPPPLLLLLLLFFGVRYAGMQTGFFGAGFLECVVNAFTLLILVE